MSQLPATIPPGRTVTCDECSGVYQVKQTRNDYRYKRRLCPTCRGLAVAQAAHDRQHTPDSSAKERIRANGLINERIKRGVVVRPPACQWCSKVGKVDAHHPDYARAELVAFLCRSCHMKCHHDPAFEKLVAEKAVDTNELMDRARRLRAAMAQTPPSQHLAEPSSLLSLPTPTILTGGNHP